MIIIIIIILLIPHWKHSPGSLITAGTDCLMTSESTSATNYNIIIIDHDSVPVQIKIVSLTKGFLSVNMLIFSRYSLNLKLLCDSS